MSDRGAVGIDHRAPISFSASWFTPSDPTPLISSIGTQRQNRRQMSLVGRPRTRPGLHAHAAPPARAAGGAWPAPQGLLCAFKAKWAYRSAALKYSPLLRAACLASSLNIVSSVIECAASTVVGTVGNGRVTRPSMQRHREKESTLCQRDWRQAQRYARQNDPLSDLSPTGN